MTKVVVTIFLQTFASFWSIYSILCYFTCASGIFRLHKNASIV